MEIENNLNVLKRDKSIEKYDSYKIYTAVLAAYDSSFTGDIDRYVLNIVNLVEKHIYTLYSNIVCIENIQDKIESCLMEVGHHKVAKAFILYREERRKKREENKNTIIEKSIEAIIRYAVDKVENTSYEKVYNQVVKDLHNKATLKDIYDVIIMATRSLIEIEPNYTYVAARVLLSKLRTEVCKHIEFSVPSVKLYEEYFPSYIIYGIDKGILSPELEKYDLNKLSKAITINRDYSFTYIGLQTLYDRYFIRSNNEVYELPQAFFMRVAMGLALNETNRNERAIEFYEVLSSFNFMSSTPTLFNSGTVRPQLSSCYLTTISDDLEGIYDGIKDNALLSKYAGGLGNDWTSVRAHGSYIKGTNGESLGIIPFLKVADSTAVAVNQGGKRKGAVCAYLECWHLDVEDFLELRKNTGDDRRRTHDMNTALWVPDLFMKRVFEDKEWTLFSPEEVSDLHELYGDKFDLAFHHYELEAEKGRIKNFKKIPAIKLWRKMLSMLFETGHPWITFKDACNIRSPQQHVGVVHSSNLCTEITLNTSKDEIAVCNLGSINLVNHIDSKGDLDEYKLINTIITAVRMLDNVIDINYYPVPEARNSNLKHRPIGLGIMGFQDVLYIKGIPYASEEAITFSDNLMEIISYYAIGASAKLAREKGKYDTYERSLWDKGILPLGSLDLLAKYRGKYLTQDISSRKIIWEERSNEILRYGLRNSNIMAIAPTATISNICGITQSIEPTYQNLYVKSNLSGEFTVINNYLVNKLKGLNIWDKEMLDDLKRNNGSVQNIDRIPNEIKDVFATAFEIDPSWLIEAASRRQKWIDQSQSVNIYMANPSGSKLDKLYKEAWMKGLKTTYYLRSLGATSSEKSTVDNSSLNAVKLCSIDDPDCDACQ